VTPSARLFPRIDGPVRSLTAGPPSRTVEEVRSRLSTRPNRAIITRRPVLRPGPSSSPHSNLRNVNQAALPPRQAGSRSYIDLHRAGPQPDSRSSALRRTDYYKSCRNKCPKPFPRPSLRIDRRSPRLLKLPDRTRPGLKSSEPHRVKKRGLNRPNAKNAPRRLSELIQNHLSFSCLLTTKFSSRPSRARLSKGNRGEDGRSGPA